MFVLQSCFIISTKREPDFPHSPGDVIVVSVLAVFPSHLAPNEVYKQPPSKCCAVFVFYSDPGIIRSWCKSCLSVAVITSLRSSSFDSKKCVTRVRRRCAVGLRLLAVRPSWTWYSEVDTRGVRLALRLQQAGQGPEHDICLHTASLVVM